MISVNKNYDDGMRSFIMQHYNPIKIYITYYPDKKEFKFLISIDPNKDLNMYISSFTINKDDLLKFYRELDFYTENDKVDELDIYSSDYFRIINTEKPGVNRLTELEIDFIKAFKLSIYEEDEKIYRIFIGRQIKNNKDDLDILDNINLHNSGGTINRFINELKGDIEIILNSIGANNIIEE